MTNTVTAASVPTVPGAPFEGGFYVGLYKQGDETRALIVSGKDGEVSGIWGEYGQDITGASSYTDGLANTQAMAKAGSELAKQVLALHINGLDDWAIPARDQLELLYRHLKPTTDENSCSFRDGDNPSSLPAGYPYTDNVPAQTAADTFKEGGENALQGDWYWASTQYSSGYAWIQGFYNGNQYFNAKDNDSLARAVRSVVIAN